MPSGSNLHRAKRAYATVAQSAGTALTRLGVLGDQAPALDRRARHWAFSLTRVHDSLAIAQLDVPWWTYDAIDAVSDWLRVHERPLRAFEYGSGASTFWLAKRFDEVYSVEHHKGFGDMMATELEPFRLSEHRARDERGAERSGGTVGFRIVEPTQSSTPRIPSGKEDHAGLDFYDYVHAIDAVDGEFDLVVIDGRAREACLAAAEPRLKAGGVIVYDNSARRRYRPAIENSSLYERKFRGLTPTLPYPEQTSVLFKARS